MLFSARIFGVLFGILPWICVAYAVNFEYCGTRDWYKYNDNCYLLGNTEKRLSFYDAEDYCRSKGSHLVSIHSKEESLFVQKLTEERSYYGRRRWIGLNVLGGERQWTDGTPVDYLDLYNKTQYKIEKCYILYTGGSFRPEHCELRYVPICKKSASDVSPSPLPPIVPDVPEGNCPHDWLQFGQKCYKFFGAKEEDRKQYKEAKLSCLALGKDHDLVSIHSMAEQAFLTEKLGDFGTSAWIGLRYVESDEIGHIMVFGWTDNSRVNFTYWAPGHPPRGTWKYCARLAYEGVAKGEWIADYCSIDKKGYICERPPVLDLPPRPPKPSSCLGNSTGYHNACYTFYPTPKSWYEAEKMCKRTGSHLVSVTDGFEQAFLFSYLHEKALHVWNGLKTFNNTRLFRWSDNEPLYYSNWKKLPQTLPNQSSCTLMTTTDGMKWNTTSCLNHLPFVCKSSSSKPPVPGYTIGDCPAGESSWIDIGDNFCYHTGDSDIVRMNWGSLSRYCLSKGMEMITLKSDDQVFSLISYLSHTSYDFWLGLIKSFDRKSFVWVDRSPLEYTNWADREPSSWSSDKDCVTFSSRDGKWKVEGCGEFGGAICRAPKILRK